MNTFAKNMLAVLAVLLIAVVLSLLSGCLVAGTAYYQLGWEEVRANGVGNTASTLVFVGTWLVAFASRR